MPSALKLSEFCSFISDALKEKFSERVWWVLAEIKERNDKDEYIYFELVEKGRDEKIVARINASVWRREAIAAFRNFEDITGKRPDKGMQVLVKAGVNYHPVYGLSLQLFDIDSQHTLGQLELQRRKTIEKLAAKPYIQLVDGMLLTPNKKLELSSVIQKIAVLTSASAAGFQDFSHAMDKNIFGYTFSFTNYFSILQGETAAEKMKEQLLKIFDDTQKGKSFDAVVIIRGGGAQSDLLPFDDFNLAHAVAKFPIPVFTGIGHLRNESIVDMTAHTAAKTPTQVAELIIDHNRTFEEEVEGLRELIVLRSSNMLSKHHRKLDHHGAIISNGTMQLLHSSENFLVRIRERVYAGAQKFTVAHRRKLDETAKGFTSLSQFYFQRQQHQLEIFSERVKNLHPENVLKRGYAMITKNEELVISASKIERGDYLKIIMKDGTLLSNIIDVKTTAKPAPGKTEK